MKADFVEDQVGTLWIAHEQAELILVAVNQEAMPAKGEIEPRLRWSLDVVDHSGAAQQLDMIAYGLPSGKLWELGEMPRSVGCSFVD